jgi:hypothetical protein
MIPDAFQPQRVNPPTTYAVIRDYEIMLSFPAQSHQTNESLWRRGRLRAPPARYSRHSTGNVIGSPGRTSTTAHRLPRRQSRGLAALSVDIRQKDRHSRPSFVGWPHIDHRCLGA